MSNSLSTWRLRVFPLLRFSAWRKTLSPMHPFRFRHSNNSRAIVGHKLFGTRVHFRLTAAKLYANHMLKPHINVTWCTYSTHYNWWSHDFTAWECACFQKFTATALKEFCYIKAYQQIKERLKNHIVIFSKGKTLSFYVKRLLNLDQVYRYVAITVCSDTRGC